jgi:hypothetical protein
VQAAAFDGFAATISVGGTVIAGQASVSLILFSMIPLVVPVLSEATIKGIAVFSGVGINLGLGAAADQFHAICTLNSMGL